MRNRVEAGKYRQVATIQERQMGQNGYGETTQDWTDVVSVRCMVAPISGREFFDKSSVNAEISHRVIMRYVRNVIKPDMRILYDGRVFLITSIIDYQELHRELQLMCKELIENE